MDQSEWNESQQLAVAQVKQMYPYLSFDERMVWIDCFEGWYPTRLACMTDLASSLKGK